MPAVPFPFRMHTCTISNWVWSFDVQKKWKASSFNRQLELIVLYCYGLLNCSGAVHYFRSSILSEFCNRGSTAFEVCYQWSIDLTLLLLGFLGSWGVIFVLATIGIVDCTFRRVGLRPSRFHSCVWGTAVLFPSQLGRTEWKHHCCFVSYCIPWSVQERIYNY